MSQGAVEKSVWFSCGARARDNFAVQGVKWSAFVSHLNVRGFCTVKRFSFGLALLAALVGAAAQDHEQAATNGIIYGFVITQDGKPAKGLTLTARPWGVAVNGGLPRARTDDAGQYRFNKVPHWGRYIVYADDEKAGYSRESTGPTGNTDPTVIEITRENPEAEFNLSLPPKAGFVRIHLNNRETRVAVRQMTVWVSEMNKPEPGLFTITCDSDHDILVPPDVNLLMHVKADGFREWDESLGTGKPINVPSGRVLTLNVQLDAAAVTQLNW